MITSLIPNSITSIIVVTGPVGVGKTSVAIAMADLLDEHDLAYAVIDMDWLCYCAPRPADDRFHERLGYANLAAVWANYRAAGANRLILVDVVETHATIEAYQQAIPNAAIQVIQLNAPLATIQQRLEQRETGATLAWHQQRAAELLDHWQRNPIQAQIVETADLTPHEIAQKMLVQQGWIY